MYGVCCTEWRVQVWAPVRKEGSKVTVALLYTLRSGICEQINVKSLAPWICVVLSYASTRQQLVGSARPHMGGTSFIWLETCSRAGPKSTRNIFFPFPPLEISKQKLGLQCQYLEQISALRQRMGGIRPWWGRTECFRKRSSGEPEELWSH